MNQYSYYIPQTDEALLGWSINTKEKAGIVAPLMGFPPAKVTEIQDACQALTDRLNKVLFQKTEYEAAVKAKDLDKKTQLVILRALFRLMKASTGYTEDLGRQMGIVGTSSRIASQEIKPSVSLGLVPTGVSVAFNKRGMQAVGIYSRVKGGADWLYIGSHDVSPFIDTRPLTVAGKPEIREYRAICRDAVREIGMVSASEEIVYSGPQGVMV